MKKLPIFLVFLIVTLAVSINLVRGSPDTESLYVSGFTSVLEEWDETGTSPWLSDSDANYISTSVDEEWHEEFTFADSGVGSGTINSVYLYVEVNGPSGRNDRAEFYVWNNTASAWVNVLNQDPDGDGYVWYNVEVTTTVIDWTGIDAAKLKVEYQRAGSPSTETIYVRRAYLYIDYSATGQAYIADLTQSISSTWDILTKTDFQIVPSQSLTTSWDTLTEWDAITDLTQTISSSWNVLMKWDAIADFSQTITTAWDIILSHGMFADLSQSITSSWEVLTQWNAVLDLSQSLATSWDVLIGWNAITDLSQSLTTTWGILTQSTFSIIPDLTLTTSWIVDVVLTLAGGIDYTVDISQSLSTTWEVLTKSTFNITPSVSITTSWIVDAFTGQQFIVDLTQAISITATVVTRWMRDIGNMEEYFLLGGVVAFFIVFTYGLIHLKRRRDEEIS